MPLPVVTPEQRAEALRKAAEVRAARSNIKTALKRGTLTLPEVIAGSDDITGRMKVSAVIQSLPGMGKVKTAHLMNRLGIADNRRVAALTARQRAALETAFAPLD